MLKNFYLLFFIFFLSSEIYPQWVETNGPYGGWITALTSSANYLFAGTDGGGIYRSSNNGINWTSISSLPSNTNVNVFATIDSLLFAGTNDKGVFRSSDYGMSWYEVNSGLPDSCWVIDFKFSNNKNDNPDLFVSIGNSSPWESNSISNAGIFHSTNNGSSWTKVWTSFQYGWGWTTMLETIRSKTGTMNLFAGISWGGGLLRFTENDTCWTVDTVISNNSVFCLAAEDTNLFAGTWDGVLLSTDNGLSWTILRKFNDCVYTLAVNGNYLFANTGPGGVYVSTNNGISWNPTSSGLHPNGRTYIQEFAFIPNNNGGSNVFAGTWDGVFLSTDNGTNWTEANTGITATSVNGITVIPNENNQSNLFACTDKGVFISNNGIDWTQMDRFTDYGISCIFSVPNKTGGNNILAGGDGIFLSKDNGKNWSNIQLGTYVNSFVSVDSDIFASTGAGVFRSMDYGENWTIVASTGLPYETGVYSLALIDSNLFANTMSGVFLSTNKGSRWTAVNNGLPKHDTNGVSLYLIRDLEVIGKNLFVSSYYGVFLSTDNGTSWKETGLVNRDIIRLYAGPDGVSLFAATIDPGEVFLSIDNGRNWNKVDTGLHQNSFVGTFAALGNNLYAGTSNSGVWYRPLQEMITDVENKTELPKEFVLYQNYPNPFNSSTTINYFLSKSSFVILKIYNILGKEITTLVNERKSAGNYSVNFNASNLPSGVYFYRIQAIPGGKQAGNFVQTKKLVLLK